MRALLREPLVHFVVLGALVFCAQWLLSGDDERVIEVTANTRDRAAGEYEKRTGREPSAAEADALVERWVEDEALYRKAIELGLDKNDPVIRQRLVTKMRFLLRTAREPSDAELQTYLDAHRARYDAPGRFSFAHVFSKTKPAGVKVQQALAAGASPKGLGAPFPLGSQVTRQTAEYIGARFGERFVASLGGAERGVWVGPIESSFGWHAVRVNAQELGQPVALVAVKAAVRRDYLEEAREAAQVQAVEALLDEFEVRLP